MPNSTTLSGVVSALISSAVESSSVAASSAGATFAAASSADIAGTARPANNSAVRASNPLRGLLVFMGPSAPQRPLVGDIGRVVGAMDVGMAVHATASDGVLVGAEAGTRSAGHGAAMARRLMAGLAEERRALAQHVRQRGAVRVVADRAVL